jgi:hypothetical protein
MCIGIKLQQNGTYDGPHYHLFRELEDGATLLSGLIGWRFAFQKALSVGQEFLLARRLGEFPKYQGYIDMEYKSQLH